MTDAAAKPQSVLFAVNKTKPSIGNPSRFDICTSGKDITSEAACHIALTCKRSMTEVFAIATALSTKCTAANMKPSLKKRFLVRISVSNAMVSRLVG